MIQYKLYINNEYMTDINYVAEGMAKHYIGYEGDDGIWGTYLTIRKKDVDNSFDYSNFKKYINDIQIKEIKIIDKDENIIYLTTKYNYLRGCELFRLDTESNANLNTFICIFANSDEE